MPKETTKGGKKAGIGKRSSTVDAHYRQVAERLEDLPADRKGQLLIRILAAFHRIDSLHPLYGPPSELVVRNEWQQCIEAMIASRHVYLSATARQTHPTVDERISRNLDAMIGYMRDAADPGASTFVRAHRGKKRGAQPDQHRAAELKDALAICFKMLMSLNATSDEALTTTRETTQSLSQIFAPDGRHIPSDPTVRNRASKLGIPDIVRQRAMWALRGATGDQGIEALPHTGAMRETALAAVAMIILKEPVEKYRLARSSIT